MQTKIWNKLLDIKLGEEYLRLYLSLQKSMKKRTKVLTLILSLSGILSWKFFENYILLVLILISGIQLFSLIQNQFLRSDQEIEEIAALRVLYSSNLTRIEKLWLQFQKHELTEEQASKKYFKFLEFERSDVLTIDDKLGIKDIKRLRKQAEQDTLIYMKKYNTI